METPFPLLNTAPLPSDAGDHCEVGVASTSGLTCSVAKAAVTSGPRPTPATMAKSIEAVRIELAAPISSIYFLRNAGRSQLFRRHSSNQASIQKEGRGGLASIFTSPKPGNSAPTSKVRASPQWNPTIAGSKKTSEHANLYNSAHPGSYLLLFLIRSRFNCRLLAPRPISATSPPRKHLQ